MLVENVCLDRFGHYNIRLSITLSSMKLDDIHRAWTSTTVDKEISIPNTIILPLLISRFVPRRSNHVFHQSNCPLVVLTEGTIRLYKKRSHGFIYSDQES